MSNEKNPLAAMLAQYENNNKPKYEKKEKPKGDDVLKNYFNVFLKDGVNTATKTIRILPTEDGSSPFVEVHFHKGEINGEDKKFACLKEEKGEACPFCEARELLLATGEESKKEMAKKYKARMMYVVKVIDRDNEADGVKFWRFNHDFRNEGIYDKIYALINAIKKDITHADTGRDIVLTINRNQNKIPVVSGIATLDPTPLTDDAAKKQEWLTDNRTWEDVFPPKPYDFLEIIVRGLTPVWDKEAKKFVAKETDTVSDETKQLDSELTMGLETVKNNVQAASTPASTPAESTADNDDLPF